MASYENQPVTPAARVLSLDELEQYHSNPKIGFKVASSLDIRHIQAARMRLPKNQTELSRKRAQVERGFWWSLLITTILAMIVGRGTDLPFEVNVVAGVMLIALSAYLFRVRIQPQGAMSRVFEKDQMDELGRFMKANDTVKDYVLAVARTGRLMTQEEFRVIKKFMRRHK